MTTARSLSWHDVRPTRDHERYGRLAAWTLIVVALGSLLLLTIGTANAPPTMADVAQLTQAP